MCIRDSPYSYNVQYGFTIIAYYSGAEAQSSTVYKTIAAPSITKQPAVTKVSPTSGKQTTITWSAAQVANQGIAVIDYHYYIGTKKTYSGNASYIGGTRNLSATISQKKSSKNAVLRSEEHAIFLSVQNGTTERSEADGPHLLLLLSHLYMIPLR